MEKTLATAPAPGTAARRRPLRRILGNWRQRHQHPFNFAIHLIGIPTVLVGLGFLAFGYWFLGAGLFVAGYALQYVGHLVEGNDLGEWAGVKRMLGLPYIGISPRWEHADAPRSASQVS
jgi:hypothetical protein